MASILCLGAGAVGGYYAGRLVEAGSADVTFLVRERRRRQLAEHGLEVESPCGDFRVPVKATLAEELTGSFDFVLVTCKAYDLDAAIAAMHPAVGQRTTIVPLLNGFPHLDRLNAELGADRVLGGFASIAVTMQPDGRIEHLNDWQYITFGEQDGKMTDRVRLLEAAFRASRIGEAATGVPDVQQKMWEKLVLLATLASVTTLMRASIGEIARAPGGIATMQEVFERNAEIAARSGHPMPEAYLAQYRALFSDSSLPMTASMLRDIEGKGQIEADHIVGYMLEKARATGVDDTLHALSYLHLKAYEQRRAAGRL
jgi:2-dehydropantoate 2-reductase